MKKYIFIKTSRVLFSKCWQGLPKRGLSNFSLNVECIPTRRRECYVLLMVTSNVIAVKCGPFCILVDKTGQGTELGGSFAYVGYLTNLGLMRFKEV